MKFKKLFSLSTLLAVAVSPSFAQCVVGGTNFDVPTSLFDPAMENDNNPINGWLNENARDILDDMCGGTCSYYELPSKANQIGLKTNTIVSDGGLPPENYDPTSVTAPVVGAVVANPKLIHPYFMDMPGSNMFVNIGSAHRVPVLTYTVSGLEPGSRVSFSADAYSLFDVDVLKYLYSEGVSVLNLKYGIYSYNETSNTLNGNGLSVAVGSSLQPNGELEEAMANGKPIPYGKSISLTSTATVDEYGSVTFYIARGSDSKAIPLGIDNIEIKGEIKPNIKTVATPCPAMGSLFSLRSTYPEGTTYSWKEDKTGDRSDKQSFTFSPPDVGDYAVSCEVSLPGCSPVVSDKYEFTVGNCCSDGNGTPMSMSYLLYEDFGDFTSAKTYEYTDEKMVTHTINIPASQIMYTEDKGNLPFVVDYPGSDAIQVPPCRPNSGIWDGTYAISNLNPYSRGVQHDNSGTNTGGMMVIDLTDSSCLDVLYERTISGLCPGKELRFRADFAAANKPASERLVGTLALQLVDALTGEELYISKKELIGNDSWYTVEYSLNTNTLPTESVILRVLNLTPSCEGPGIAGFAIDNIIVSACTPPDINISSNLSSSELLDLCAGMPLVLEAENSMAAKNYYEEISYLFQYTYSDPSTTDTEKITWHNLGDVQKNNTFEIAEPASHIAFAPLAGTNDRIYFRVLMGNESDLNTPSLWEPYDAFSPCRIISYSAFPVVAGLNCAVCTTPDPVEFSVVGGKFNAANKTVEIKIDETAELGMANAVHGIDNEGIDYFDYVVEWFKEDVKSDALVSKECTSADNVAPSIIVDYADVENAGATGVKYIIYLHDNFDPVLQTPCDIMDTITVIAKDPTSLDNYSANTILITPNPASTKISVVAEGVVEKVEILNVVGEVVKVSNSKEINIANLYNGVYFVRIIVDGETTVHKLVINK